MWVCKERQITERTTVLGAFMAAEGGCARERKGGGEMFAERAAVWTGCQRVRGGGEWFRRRRGDGGNLGSCQKI